MTALGPPGHRAALAGGLGVALVVLSPPVERWASGSLTGHMLQHVVLIGAAGPLLALGAPSPARPRGAALLAAAVVTHTVAVLGWHAPALFDAAEDAAGLHVVEHLCLVAAGVLLWWAAIRGGGPAGRGPGALAVFVALLPLTVLGVGMTLATSTWYAHHPDLTDQQVGGVVMWAGGGLLALVGAVALGTAWVAWAGGDAATDTVPEADAHADAATSMVTDADADDRRRVVLGRPAADPHHRDHHR